ncbi:MAG: DUF2149 domain-containing protein [Lachnospiraceae bacterium]|nr:DUF2149 domain-containing protein [Lachnospiraceae bacterium]
MKRTLNVNDNFDNDASISPMDYISNMSDAMLVLAVGIMLALIINWKIDINVNSDSTTVSSSTNVEESDMQEYEFDDTNQNTEMSLEEVENNYVKSGTVYTDTTTGKTYVVLD